MNFNPFIKAHNKSNDLPKLHYDGFGLYQTIDGIAETSAAQFSPRVHGVKPGCHTHQVT